MTFIAKIVDTAHRLAASRKVVAQAALTLAGLITESLNLILMWVQVFGADKDKQAKLEATLHVISGTLVLIGNRLGDQMTREDVALKTAQPPPQIPLPPAQTNTVNVTTEPSAAPKPMGIVEANSNLR